MKNRKYLASFAARFRQHVGLMIVTIFFFFPCKPASAQSSGNETPSSAIENREFQSRAGQGVKKLQRRLYSELAATIEKGNIKHSDNPLRNIAGNMLQVCEHLSEADAMPAALDLQKKIISDLDRLIDEARRRATQNFSSGTDRVGSPGEVIASESQENIKLTKPFSAKSDWPAPKFDPKQLRSTIKKLWGKLPPKMRPTLQQLPTEDIVPKYESLIEDYYRQLADDKKD